MLSLVSYETFKFIKNLFWKNDKNNFLSQKKIYCKIELKNNICINVYCCENGMVYHVYLFIGDSW